MKNLKYIVRSSLITLLMTGACSMEIPESDPSSLLPDTIGDWKKTSEDQRFDSESLYTYIDGGAELYISYGFKEVLSRIYSNTGQPDILVDIFDMEDSRNAFGVFSHARETVDSTFGQGSQYTEGSLLFWKDRYFISILASPETKESKKAVFNIAGKIDVSISREGPLPETLDLLPQRSLVEESIRYFRHHIWLNSHYYVADQNILNIDEKTDAVLAKYGETAERHILLLVKYETEGDAKGAFDSFTASYLPELSENCAVQIEDGTWTGCLLSGNLVIVVFNAPGEDQAISLMEAIRERADSSN
jgi:hypothetical protein